MTIKTSQSGGELLLRCLETQQVKRIFCVPGESYLAVLDALHDSTIDTVTCRHESGAAIMAEVEGKLSGRPGVAFVTRGPGATNAAAGIHIAQQDSTPMILFIGQIARNCGGRDAFQEVDYRQLFGGMAKWVDEIHDAERIPEIISHAWHVAMSGRPGPVVLALPEDMLRDQVEGGSGEIVQVASPSPAASSIDTLKSLLQEAKNPLLLAGGSRWSQAAISQLSAFCASWDLPLACSFRRQTLIDNHNHCYAGDVGLAINPKLLNRLKIADLVILLGGRFSEIPSQGFSLFGSPDPGVKLVHVHPGAEELGRIYQPDLAINSTPEEFLSLAIRGSMDVSLPRCEVAHQEYLDWSEPTPLDQHSVDMRSVIGWMSNNLQDDAVLTNGAGNYTLWVQRFYRFRKPNTQMASISGSMGYGIPAAIAAKLHYPDRTVVCLAGDGCFQMTSQEIATAVQLGAAIIVLVVDNGMYGTIRLHQQRNYPERVSGTLLQNPDFVALARAYGGYGEAVDRGDEFPQAFERAQQSGLPAILHLKVDPDVITPTTRLSSL
ncbi:MAG: acetolactate synthase-1/2/3 large subunit [Parasphingorhabdus sp.]|jgi:acetolactate synthase-1/2/3 large subunit